MIGKSAPVRAPRGIREIRQIDGSPLCHRGHRRPDTEFQLAGHRCVVPALLGKTERKEPGDASSTIAKPSKVWRFGFFTLWRSACSGACAGSRVQAMSFTCQRLRGGLIQCWWRNSAIPVRRASRRTSFFKSILAFEVCWARFIFAVCRRKIVWWDSLDMERTRMRAQSRCLISSHWFLYHVAWIGKRSAKDGLKSAFNSSQPSAVEHADQSPSDDEFCRAIWLSDDIAFVPSAVFSFCTNSRVASWSHRRRGKWNSPLWLWLRRKLARSAGDVRNNFGARCENGSRRVRLRPDKRKPREHDHARRILFRLGNLFEQPTNGIRRLEKSKGLWSDSEHDILWRTAVLLETRPNLSKPI